MGWGVLQISSGRDDQRIFLGLTLNFSISGFFGRKFGKYFFVWLDLSRYLSRNFWGIENNLNICICMVVLAYPGHIVLQIKYSQTCFPVVLIFNACMYCSEIRHGFLWGLIFGPGIFFGFVGSPRDFLGFDFCPHLIIPVT